jgi:hypothetical protein
MEPIVRSDRCPWTGCRWTKSEPLGDYNLDKSTASYDRPVKIEVTPAMIEAGALALMISGYSSEFQPTTAAQAVREVVEAIGLRLRLNEQETSCEQPM